MISVLVDDYGHKLSPLIHWPDRESLIRTMPQCFKFSFGTKATVITDCFEIFIEKSSNLLAGVQTFSSHKHHNTTKVLIGITPQGTISYASEAWDGRTSDKFLTENCGILRKKTDELHEITPADVLPFCRKTSVGNRIFCCGKLSSTLASVTLRSEKNHILGICICHRKQSTQVF